MRRLGQAVLWMFCGIALPQAAVLGAPATGTLDQLMSLLGQQRHQLVQGVGGGRAHHRG